MHLWPWRSTNKKFVERLTMTFTQYFFYTVLLLFISFFISGCTQEQPFLGDAVRSTRLAFSGSLTDSPPAPSDPCKDAACNCIAAPKCENNYLTLCVFCAKGTTTGSNGQQTTTYCSTAKREDVYPCLECAGSPGREALNGCKGGNVCNCNTATDKPILSDTGKQYECVPCSPDERAKQPNSKLGRWRAIAPAAGQIICTCCCDYDQDVWKNNPQGKYCTEPNNAKCTDRGPNYFCDATTCECKERP